MALTVSRQTAERALARLEMNGDDAARAAHDVWIGLRAIEPYTDRKSALVLEVLRRVQRAEERGNGELRRAQLRAIAAGEDPATVTV